MNIGDPIPAFAVQDQDGNLVTNETFLGSKTVLYFYPKDSTPGCTAEACNLRDDPVPLLSPSPNCLWTTEQHRTQT